jgi:hypothetical protein
VVGAELYIVGDRCAVDIFVGLIAVGQWLEFGIVLSEFAAALIAAIFHNPLVGWHFVRDLHFY